MNDSNRAKLNDEMLARLIWEADQACARWWFEQLERRGPLTTEKSWQQYALRGMAEVKSEVAQLQQDIEAAAGTGDADEPDLRRLCERWVGEEAAEPSSPAECRQFLEEQQRDRETWLQTYRESRRAARKAEKAYSGTYPPAGMKLEKVRKLREGLLLTILRALSGLTQQELADKTEELATADTSGQFVAVPRIEIGRYENAKVSAPPDALRSLAKVLGVAWDKEPVRPRTRPSSMGLMRNPPYSASSPWADRRAESYGPALWTWLAVTSPAPKPPEDPNSPGQSKDDMPTLTDLSERLSSIRDEKLSSLRKESASSGKALQRLAAVFEDATALERFRGRDRLTELIEWVRSPQDREEPLFDEGTICWLLDFWAWDEDRPPAVTVQTLAEELRLNATATIIGLEQQEDDAGRTGSSEEDPVTPREYGPFSVTVEHGAPPTTTDHQPPLTEVVEEILNLLVIEDPDRAPLLLHALCQLSNSERHLVEPVVASLLSSRSPLEHELDRYWNPTPKEQDAIDVTRDDEPEDHDDA